MRLLAGWDPPRQPRCHHLVPSQPSRRPHRLVAASGPLALRFRPPRLTSGRPLLPSASPWCASRRKWLAGRDKSGRSVVRRGRGWGWAGWDWCVDLSRASPGWGLTWVLRPHSPGTPAARRRTLNFLLWKMMAAASSGLTGQLLDNDHHGGGDISSHLLCACLCQALSTFLPKSGFPTLNAFRVPL